jgi:protein-disulfide isomerase
MKPLGVLLAVATGIALVLVAGRVLLSPGAARARQDQSPPGSAMVASSPAPPPAPPPGPPPGQLAEDPKAVYRVPLEGSPSRGPADALVAIVEFSDVECAFCEQATAVRARLEAKYGGKLRVVWKHRPMSFHQNAVPAAMMAEAVRAKGGDAGFWAFVDTLFDLEKLDPGAIDRLAREAGVDPVEVRANPSSLIDLIRRDQNLATSLGVMTTPTSFVNGRKLVGLQRLETLEALVDEELAKAAALVKGGIPA